MRCVGVGRHGLAQRALGALLDRARQPDRPFARALAQEPREPLLDEPTNHLGIQHQLDLMDLIAALASEPGLLSRP